MPYLEAEISAERIRYILGSAERAIEVRTGGRPWAEVARGARFRGSPAHAANYAVIKRASTLVLTPSEFIPPLPDPSRLLSDFCDAVGRK